MSALQVVISCQRLPWLNRVSKLFQVLPSVQATFPPGLYFPRRARSPLMHGSKQQPRYVPFETINGLYYISTRNDTAPDPPKTRANAMMR